MEKIDIQWHALSEEGNYMEWVAQKKELGMKDEGYFGNDVSDDENIENFN